MHIYKLASSESIQNGHCGGIRKQSDSFNLVENVDGLCALSD